MRGGLAEFFLVQEYDQPREYDLHGEYALPARDRRPIDPGFVLTWREHPADGGPAYERRGMVWSPAQPAKSVWVIPDDPRPGEGYAVLVREVTADNAAGAARRVGGSGDFASTAEWQAPRSLPRAVLRTDVVVTGDSRRPTAYLHSRADCPEPGPAPYIGIAVERGEPVELPDCYVFGQHLHPASTLPRNPAGQMGYDPYARPCGRCLRHGQPV